MMTPQSLRWRSTIFVLFALLTTVTACDNPGLNEPIECSRGVPSSDNTECVSAENCEGDFNKCLDGYRCDDNHQCVEVSCSDTKRCTSGDCYQGMCVSKSICTTQTEDEDCVGDEYCVNARCEAPVKCETLSCDPTQSASCKKRAENCIEQKTCEGSQGCRYGRFCDTDNNKCKDDPCLTKDCPDGGLCRQSDGTCYEPKNCENQGHCIGDPNGRTGNVCVTDDTDNTKKCIDYVTVCSKTCRNTQKCEYSSQNSEMTCGDTSCVNVKDCRFSEYCDGEVSACKDISSYTCVNDKYESKGGGRDNNTPENATPVDSDGTLTLTQLMLCGGDVDYFVISDPLSYLDSDKVMHLEFRVAETSKYLNFDARVTIWGKTGNNPLTELTHQTIKSNEDYRDKLIFDHPLGSKSFDKLYISVQRIDDNVLDNDKSLGLEYSLTVRPVLKTLLDMCEKAKKQPLTFTKEGDIQVATEVDSLSDIGLSTAMTYSCTNTYNNSVDIREKGYVFTVKDSPKLVNIELSSENSSSFVPVLVLTNDCYIGEELSDPNGLVGCFNSPDSNTPSEFKTLLKPGEYTVVVTTDNISNHDAEYRLKVQLSNPTCDPKATNRCDGDNFIQCDNFLEKESPAVDCNLTKEKCITYEPGLVGCSNDLGQTCDKAHLFSAGKPIEQLELNTALMSGQSQFGDSLFNCNNQLDENQVSGREIFVRGMIPAHSRGLVTVTPKKDGLFTIYTSKSCELINCEGISYRKSDEGSPTTLSYDNQTDQEEEVIFVIESHFGFSGAFTLDAKIESNLGTDCQPGSTICDKSDPSKVKLCLADGSAYEEVSCMYGAQCSDTKVPAQCEKKGDSCTAPLVMTKNETTKSFNLHLKEYNNREPSCSSLFNISSLPLPEIVLEVEAGENSFIDISATAQGDVSIWRADSCPIKSCVYSRNSYRKGETEYFSYTTPQEGKYYFVFEIDQDGLDLNEVNSDLLNIEVSVLPRDCNEKLTKPTCNGSKDKIAYCDYLNIKREKTCDCEELDGISRCKNEANGSCYAPIVIDRSSSPGTVIRALFDYQDKSKMPNNDIEVFDGVNGECSLEGASYYGGISYTLGPDLVYLFDLKENERLKYRVRLLMDDGTEFQNGPFFVDSLRTFILPNSCDTTHCRNMRDGQIENGKDKYYYARGDEKVYLVIDTATWNTAGFNIVNLELVWSIEPAGSDKGNLYDSYCDSNNNGVVLMTPDNSGNIIETSLNCPNGTTCKNGGCTLFKDGDELKGDVCDDGPDKVALLESQDLPTFFTVQSQASGVKGEPTSTLTPNCANDSSYTPYGPDYFVKVKVPNGKILRVRGFSGSVSVPYVYIGETCDELKNNNCLAYAKGNHKYINGTAFAYYENDTGTEVTVVVGLDRTIGYSLSYLKEVFYYYFDLTTPTCSKGQSKCSFDSATNKAFVEKCEGGEWSNPQPCRRTNQCSGDVCLEKGDTYSDAFVLNTVIYDQPEQVEGFLSGASNTSDSLIKTNEGAAGSMVYGSCLFNRFPSGHDQYYKITLNKGDHLQATLSNPPTATNPERGFVFYLLKSDGKTCIVSSEKMVNSTLSEPLKLDFQSAEGGTYYLVVDRVTQNLVTDRSNDFVIDYVVTHPNKCVTYQTECLDSDADGKKLSVCNEGDINRKDYTCPFGCIGRACRSEVAHNTNPAPNPSSLNTCGGGSPEIDNKSGALYIFDRESSVFNLNKVIGFGVCSGTNSDTALADNDMFLKISLEKDEFVRIRDERNGTWFTPFYYLLNKTECQGGRKVTDCLMGKDAPVPGNVNYHSTLLVERIAPSAEKVYLGITEKQVSTRRDGNYNDALFFVDVLKKECNVQYPSSAPLECEASKNGVEYCSSELKKIVYSCDNCNGSICENNHAGDTPFDAIKLTWNNSGAGNIKTAKYSGNITNYHSYYGEGTTSVCSQTTYAFAGHDVFFDVTLNQGEKLTAKLTGTEVTGFADTKMYLIKKENAYKYPPIIYNGPFPTCETFVDNEFGSMNETLTYSETSNSPVDYLLVVDAEKINNNDYDFKLELKIEAP